MHIDVVQSTSGASLQPAKPIKTGDVVHGKVMAAADGKATIKLQDGSSFSATLAEGVSLKDGQQVKLVVTGQQDGKMTMQIAPEGEAAARLAESTLAGMKLPMGGQNVQLATAFLRQGVSLSPELMQRAADILAENPGLDADTAAFMATNNMDSSLAQSVQDLAGRQNSISSQLAALEQILIGNEAAQQGRAIQGDGQTIQTGQATQADQTTTTGQSGQSAQSALPGQIAPANQQAAAGEPQAVHAEQPTGNTTGQTGANNQGAQPAGTSALNGETSPATQGAETMPGQTKPVQEGAAQTGQAKQSVAQGERANQHGMAAPLQGEPTEASQPRQAPAYAIASRDGQTAVAGQPFAAGQAGSAGQPLQNVQVAGGGMAGDIAGAEQLAQPQADFRPGPETAKALTIFIGRDNPGAVAALQGEGVAAAAEAMTHAASLPVEQGEAVLQGFIDSNPQLAAPDAEKLIAQLRGGAQALRESVQPNQDGIGQLLNKLGDMFAKLDKDASKGIELKQANRLPEKLEDMQQAIAKAVVGGKEAMTATVQRALGQSKAMEQINQFAYTQIPMDINGRKDMAELYVFKRPGKQKRIDAEQVTMVIALDTQNIGHVESLIKVDGKNVFLRFRVDGNGIADALRAGTMEAGEALSSIGYNLLELRCELNEEDINILNAASTVQAEFLDVRNLDFFI